MMKPEILKSTFFVLRLARLCMIFFVAVAAATQAKDEFPDFPFRSSNIISVQPKKNSYRIKHVIRWTWFLCVHVALIFTIL